MGFKVNAKKRAVVFDCPTCGGSELRCPFEEAGTRQRCPTCTTSFRVPGGDEVKAILAEEHGTLELARRRADELSKKEAEERRKRDEHLESQARPPLDDRTLDALAADAASEGSEKRGSIEECANCGRTIGRLETAHVFKDQTVCAECFARLKPTVGYETPASLAAPAPAVSVRTAGVARACPACGSTRPAEKKSKGSTALLILLLLFWIVPGLLYLIFYSGVCPQADSSTAMRRDDGRRLYAKQKPRAVAISL